MSITETLKKTIDDLHIEQRLAAVSGDLDRVYATTLQSVSGYVAAREDDITALVDKVATTLDTRTEGRYTGEIGKVTETVRRGVTKLVEQGPSRGA